MTTNKKAMDLLKREIDAATFGTFLRAARTAMDATQSEMAELLAVSKSVVCDIEKGRQMVSPALAIKIAKKAGLSEKLAVKLCLQDQLNKAKIRLSVDVTDAA